MASRPPNPDDAAAAAPRDPAAPPASIDELPLDLFDEDTANDSAPVDGSVASAGSAPSGAAPDPAAGGAPPAAASFPADAGIAPPITFQTVEHAPGTAAWTAASGAEQAEGPARFVAAWAGATAMADALVGVGPRAAAVIIDGVVLFFTFIGMGGLVSAAEGASTGIACAWIIGVLLYFPIMERYFGATLGKLALGLRVVREDGSPLDWQSSILRNVLRLVDGIANYLVGAILIWTSPTKQRLGDRVAHTLVVKKNALSRDAVLRF
jgi:uncharacterized RDD family membrane protein YckC